MHAHAAVPEENLGHPLVARAFGGTKVLVGGYLGISVLTLLAIALLRDDSAVVNDAVWIRGGAVVAGALVMFASALRAAHGSRAAYRRLRIVSGVMIGAIVLVVALPGTFPLWLKIEQGVCGLLLIGVAVIVNSGRLRTLFATR